MNYFESFAVELSSLNEVTFQHLRYYSFGLICFFFFVSYFLRIESIVNGFFFVFHLFFFFLSIDSEQANG